MTYRYNGPVCAMILAGKSVRFIAGTTHDLPDSPQVRRMLRLGLLSPVESSAPKGARKDTQKGGASTVAVSAKSVEAPQRSSDPKVKSNG